jgi:hypothetical protein
VAAKFTEADQVGNLIQTFATSLASVAGQDDAIQQDIAAVNKSLQTIQAELETLLRRDAKSVFEGQIPSFVYHSTTLDKIPNEVDIAEFVANPEAVSRGMANLCGVAGLSMQKIQELAASSDTATIETFEDDFRTSMSGAINEFWTQETYSLGFRFSQNKMSVSISDETYSRRIPPLERSDGFQWYLSFYATLQNEVSKAASAVVFLLDNPALELHSDGQRDIKRYLEEKLMRNAQIIYVTHSPAMIDPFRLDQVRKVELQPDFAGTKVSELAKDGGDFDLYDPVRTAIGASLATSLIMNDLNILVEGAADKPILEGALKKIHKDAAEKVLVNGSVSESKDGFLVRFYARAKLPFVVYLDADSGGRDIAGSLEKWEISQDKITNLRDVFSDRQNDFEIEDIISDSDYHKAVCDEYPTLRVDLQSNPAGKRTSRYEAVFKEVHHIGFSKRRVAERVKTLLLEGATDAETDKNLAALTNAILEKMNRQIDPMKGAVLGQDSRQGHPAEKKSRQKNSAGQRGEVSTPEKQEPPAPAALTENNPGESRLEPATIDAAEELGDSDR